jgi:exonuclease VII small subunit
MSRQATPRRVTFSLISIAIAAIVLVIGTYVANFYKTSVSVETETWGQFSDYVGGLLNPILSLLALVAVQRAVVLETRRRRGDEFWAALQRLDSCRHQLITSAKSSLNESILSFERVIECVKESDEMLFRSWRLHVRIAVRAGQVAAGCDSEVNQIVVKDFFHQIELDDFESQLHAKN